MPKAPPRFHFGKQPERKPWANGSHRPIAGRALQKARGKLFAAEPLCRECHKQGRVTIATIRDHIRPLAFGGLDDEANTQPLCKLCHDAKAKAESADGARAARQ